MNPNIPQKIEISSRTIFFTVFFLIFLRILWVSRELIYALFIAFIFMSALKPAVFFWERRKLPHSLSVLLIYLSTLSIIIFMLSFVLPPLIQESISFIKHLPILINTTIPSAAGYLNTASITRFLPDITQNFLKFVSGIFANLIFVITINFFTFYFLIEEKFVKKFLDKFIEEKEVNKIINIVDKVEQRMGAWVRGEAILMTIIGLSTYIGLSLLGISYALPLAIIAGLLEVVPNIGPILSAIPAFFVAASISPFLGLSVIALYIVIQQLENNLIVPLVMQRAVGLNPIITLIALTVGLKLGGSMGILLSVPTALFIETVLVELPKLKK